MTIADIAEVQPCIDFMEITARNDGRRIHAWHIGIGAGKIKPPGLIQDWTKGVLTFHDVNINHHGMLKKDGTSEMAWGLYDKAFPKELLAAEVTHMSMRCANGISFSLFVDVEMNDMTAEMITLELNKD